MRTIAHISDIHFGRVDLQVAEALAEDIAALNPNVVVVSGDLTQRARARQYRQAVEFLRRLPQPRIVVPGNHDVPMYDWLFLPRLFRPMERYRRHVSADFAPSYVDDEIAIAGVNTARAFTRKSGWIDAAQIAALRRTFSGLAPGIMKALVTHHPFIPPAAQPSADALRRARQSLEALDQCGIDIVLAGHLHRAYHADVRSVHGAAGRSILSIQAGSAASTRLRGERNSYNAITLGPDFCRIVVRAWNGDAFEIQSDTRYARRDHLWEKHMVAAVAPAASEKND